MFQLRDIIMKKDERVKIVADYEKRSHEAIWQFILKKTNNRDDNDGVGEATGVFR